jgi:hypothetical protein
MLILPNDDGRASIGRTARQGNDCGSSISCPLPACPFDLSAVFVLIGGMGRSLLIQLPPAGMAVHDADAYIQSACIQMPRHGAGM